MKLSSLVTTLSLPRACLALLIGSLPLGLIPTTAHSESGTPSPLVAPAFDHTHATYHELLQTHVKDGKVNYAALKESPAGLDAYLKQLATLPEADFKAWTKSQRLATLINLYNAATLKLIIAHYPVKSIRDIPGPSASPWKRPEVELSGKKLSLDALENEIIRPEYKEPRIHFALVCAAVSCPPLRSEAYTDLALETQLTEQTKSFLSNPTFNKLEGKTLHLSSIFEWYGEDFTGGVTTYIAPYFSEAERAQILKKPTIKYLDYSWELNKQ